MRGPLPCGGSCASTGQSTGLRLQTLRNYRRRLNAYGHASMSSKMPWASCTPMCRTTRIHCSSTGMKCKLRETHLSPPPHPTVLVRSLVPSRCQVNRKHYHRPVQTTKSLLAHSVRYMLLTCKHSLIYMSRLGTLTLGLKGEARFYGSTARPEVCVQYTLSAID